MVRWIAALVALDCVIVFACFKVDELRLSYVPEGLNVSTVLYANEQSWGSPALALPGDNETGVIVYELPRSTARKIESAGIEYLEKLPGSHDDWKRTPVSELEWVKEPISGAILLDPALGIFLNRYGFGIDVNSDVEKLIDDAVTQPGSYYARGRIGTLIVIPAKRRVAFVYAG
jgi:hypothetical protein